MLGAIAGDVIGSVHEHLGTKSMDFELFAPECRFTDDTVLTVAARDTTLGRDGALKVPGGVFLRGLTWSPDGSSFIVGRYRWTGDVFLAERSTPP